MITLLEQPILDAFDQLFLLTKTLDVCILFILIQILGLQTYHIHEFLSIILFNDGVDTFDIDRDYIAQMFILSEAFLDQDCDYMIDPTFLYFSLEVGFPILHLDPSLLDLHHIQEAIIEHLVEIIVLQEDLIEVQDGLANSLNIFVMFLVCLCKQYFEYGDKQFCVHEQGFLHAVEVLINLLTIFGSRRSNGYYCYHNYDSITVPFIIETCSPLCRLEVVAHKINTFSILINNGIYDQVNLNLNISMAYTSAEQGLCQE